MSQNNPEESSRSSVPQAEGKSEERKLIEAAQGGNQAAFGKLIRMHQKRLFRMVYGMTKSFDTAEDLVQEAFIRAYKALDRFNPEFAFYPWLSTIARNLTYNQVTREEKSASLDSMAEKGFDPESEQLGPLEKLMHDEGQERFYKALMALPTKYRTVFVLRHFEDMQYHDIATHLKIPPGTVDSRLYRARQMLIEELKDLIE